MYLHVGLEYGSALVRPVADQFAVAEERPSHSPPRRQPSGRLIGRKTLLVRMPALVEGLVVDVPAMTCDREGNACLIVLPRWVGG